MERDIDLTPWILSTLNKHVVLNAVDSMDGGSHAYPRIDSGIVLMREPGSILQDAHRPVFKDSDFKPPFTAEDAHSGRLSSEIALVLSAHNSIPRHLGKRALLEPMPSSWDLLKSFIGRNKPAVLPTSEPVVGDVYTMGELVSNANNPEALAGAIVLAVPLLMLPGEVRESALYATSIVPVELVQKIFEELKNNPAATLRFMAEMVGDEGVSRFHISRLGGLPKSHEEHFETLQNDIHLGREALLRCVSADGAIEDVLIPKTV